MSRLLAALLVLMVLSACGGDPSAAPSTPSPGPTKSAEAAPVMPELAREDSKEGAKAFVRHYAQLVNHAQATGNTRELSDAEGEACGSCMRARKGVDDLYQNGGYLTGGEWSIRITSMRPSTVLDGWNVNAVVTYSKQIVHRAPGKAPSVNHAGHMNVAFFVEQQQNTWRLNQWLRIA